MDHISRVRIFIEVVNQASFVGAGRELGISGAAVSKQIQTLEKTLGVKLLNRTTRHVSATEEGSLYFERAGAALADLQEVEQQIQETRHCPAGKLKINAPTSFGNLFLVDPIASFAKQYPDVELDVNFNDGWVDVVSDGYDLVIRIGDLPDSSLVARQLGRCPILPCASPDFLERHGELSQPKQVAELPAVIYSQHGQSEAWHYQEIGTGSSGSIRLNRTMAASSGEIQLAACLSGVGFALLPIFLVAEHLKNGDLIRVLPKFQTVPERGIYALYPQNRYLATRVRLLLDWLVDCSLDFPWQGQDW